MTTGFEAMYQHMNEDAARQYAEQLAQAVWQLQRDGKPELARAVYLALQVARRDREAIFVQPRAC